MAVGEPVYNTEQRREMLRQMKEYLQEQWLKRKAQGRLSRKKIILPGAEPIKTTLKKTKREKTKRKRKRRIRVFKVFEGTKYGDQFVLKEIKRIKRKNRRYKNKNGRYFERSDRRFFSKSR